MCEEGHLLLTIGFVASKHRVLDAAADHLPTATNTADNKGCSSGSNVMHMAGGMAGWRTVVRGLPVLQLCLSRLPFCSAQQRLSITAAGGGGGWWCYRVCVESRLETRR